RNTKVSENADMAKTWATKCCPGTYKNNYQLCCGIKDDEIYGQCIHYFDEDNIDIGKEIQCKVVVNHHIELTEEEKAEARQNAIRQYQDEEIQKIKNRKKAKPAQTQTIVAPTLFDF
ncbi:PcfK-like family protein, partial [Phocaeicola dorei]|uniref:PcfK-like family protein n=1 Tax=Phocaeicola dorei TaxID=357276 RepID=UPI0032EEC57A